MKLTNFGRQCGREAVIRVGMQSCGVKRVVGGGASLSAKPSVVSQGMLNMYRIQVDRQI